MCTEKPVRRRDRLSDLAKMLPYRTAATRAPYMIPLDPQVAYLRTAGFEGVDVSWKELDFVIYGGRRPANVP